MRKLFIDANIYLGFYNSNKPEFKKLLKSLNELSEKIFLTSQVIDEVNRNKLSVFRESVDNYLRQVAFISTVLPEHLDADGSQKVKEWNKKRKELEEKGTELNKELNDIIKQIITDISISTDAISVELQKIFNNPLKLGDNTFANARLRKEVGNPPGKANDPLGDQINWCQILENLDGVTELWLVSNDFDFFVQFEKSLFLNPLLYSELKLANPKIGVFVFNKLSDALRAFNEKEHVESLPTKEELDVISIDEPETIIDISFMDKIKTMFLGGVGRRPLRCAYCDALGTFGSGEYLKSNSGGLTYQYVCSNCNCHYDTGEGPTLKTQ